ASRARDTTRAPRNGKPPARGPTPPGAVGPPRDPLRRDREAERRTADPCERAAEQRVPIPVPRNVDAHRIRSRRRLADRANVETGPRTCEVERDEYDARPRRGHEHRMPEQDRADGADVLPRLRDYRPALVTLGRHA